QATRGGLTAYYVPKSLEFEHGGDTANYSMIESATRTSSGGLGSVYFTPDVCEPGGILSARVIGFYTDYCFAMGFLPVGSTGIEQRRIEAAVKALEIRGNSNKLYLAGIDKGAITLSPGDYFSTIGYRHVYPKPTGRTSAYPVRTRG